MGVVRVTEDKALAETGPHPASPLPSALLCSRAPRTSLRSVRSALTPESCGYQKSSGICNDTIIGYPFTPFANLLADAPSKPVDYKKITSAIIPTTAEAFRDDGWNDGLSRAGSVLIFVSSVFDLSSRRLRGGRG